MEEQLKIDAILVNTQIFQDEINRNKFKYIDTAHIKVSAVMYDYQCDVKLKVGRQSFRAHRRILETRSDYFSAMFSCDMIEKKANEIELKEISPCGVACMLEYFYHGHINLHLNNVADVLEAARFFHISWLLSAATHYLGSHLALTDYNLVLQLADEFSLGDLKQGILMHVSQNFTKLSFGGALDNASISLWSDLLSTNEYYLDGGEGFLLGRLLNWIDTAKDPETETVTELDALLSEQMNKTCTLKNEFSNFTVQGPDVVPTNLNKEKGSEVEITKKYNLENLHPEHVKLLQMINWPLCTLEELEQLPPTVTEHTDLRESITAAKNYASFKPGQCIQHSSRTQPRGSIPVLHLYSAVDDAYQLQYRLPRNSAEYYTESIDTSFTDNTFEFSSSAVLGNILFITGGYDRTTYCTSSSVYCYDPRGGAEGNAGWFQLAPMLQARVSHSLVAGGQYLYSVTGIDHQVCDGTDHEKILNTVERYKPLENQWQEIAQLWYGCFCAAACWAEDRLYIHGGISDDLEDSIPVCHLTALTAPSDRGDCQAQQQSLSPSLSNRQGHNLVHVANRLYLFGGFTTAADEISFTESFDFESYDIQTDQWSKVLSATPGLELIQPGAVNHNGLIWLLSGKLCNRSLSTFDPESKSLSEPEYCGNNVKKLALMRQTFPFELE